MSPVLIAALVVSAFLISLLVTRWLVDALGEGGVMDRPNERSSQPVPPPRGGGLGLLAGAVPAWIVLATMSGSIFAVWSEFLALFLLAATSWWDDGRGLHWRTRLWAQAAALLLGVGPLVVLAAWVGASYGTAAFLFLLVAVLLLALLWLCFMKAFNSMDGIDGIAAILTIAIAGGVALVYVWHRGDASVIGAALVLVAAALGFLAWNRPPARIFMGNVGSIPIGFVLGLLLVAVLGLSTSPRVYTWGAALTLPAYIAADTLLTLVRRWWRGERFSEAHREHFYQRAAGGEKSGHARVLWRVALAHAALVGAVAVGLLEGGDSGQVHTILLGAAIVGALLIELQRLAARSAMAA